MGRSFVEFNSLFGIQRTVGLRFGTPAARYFTAFKLLVAASSLWDDLCNIKVISLNVPHLIASEELRISDAYTCYW